MNARREAQAAGTRQDIVRAAGRLMLQHGYVGTSIGAIATEAGVAVQTIYNSVGSKAEVLAALLERAATASGSPDAVATAMRQRIDDAHSASDIIRALADGCALVNERTAGIQQIVSEAAAVDPDVAAFERRRETARLHDFGEDAAALRGRRSLRVGLSDHEAAAAIWSLTHAQGYRTLVSDVGWSPDTYRDWLEKTLRGALL